MSWKRRISLFVVGLLLAFIIIEMVTRVVVGGGLIAKVYEDGFYEFEPNQHGWYNPRQPRARINNLGFRGEDIDRDNLNSSSRILFLGDSSTFGWAIEEDGIINRYFESVLKEKNISNVIVANAANGGYGLDHMIKAYEYSQTYRPDVVIMVMWETDFYRPLAPANIDPIKEAFWEIRKYSSGVSFVWWHFRTLQGRLFDRSNKSFAERLGGTVDGKPFKEENVKKLIDFNAELKKENSTLLTVFFEYEKSNYSIQAEGMCEAHGFFCITDTYRLLENLTFEQTRSRDRGHPSSLTNSLLAAAVFERLYDSGK